MTLPRLLCFGAGCLVAIGCGALLNKDFVGLLVSFCFSGAVFFGLGAIIESIHSLK